MFLTIWIISVIATIYVADQKRLGIVGFFFLALITGPLALMIVLLANSRNSSNMIKTYGANTIGEARQQLQDLKMSLYAQEEKIRNLEILINKLSGATTESPIDQTIKPEMPIMPPAPVLSAGPQPVPAALKKSDMELDFGRNWLNKIGIAVFALGMAFLISYTFKYLGPLVKIAFGYFVAGIIFYTGIKLEIQEKLKNYGRALMGGAWAIIYFTTYAMYHFDASRIIGSQFLDVLLLGGVVVGMMVHTLRYKSEGMMAVALLVAYMTTTIGPITNFTIVSNIMLALLILFLVYRFQWVKLLTLGIIMTYGIHYVWVVPHLTMGHDRMGLGFLTTYLAVFFVGAHLVWNIKDKMLSSALAASNFGNLALYSALSYPLIFRLYYDQRFEIILAEGIIYLLSAYLIKRLGQQKLFISDIVAGVFAVTYALSLKFVPSTSIILWLIEVPCLLFISINFKEKVYRYLAYALAVVVSLRIYALHLFGHLPDIEFLWAALSMAGCFGMTQYLLKEEDKDHRDELFDQLFSLSACLYMFSWIWTWVDQPYKSFVMSLQGWIYLVIGALLNQRRFRAYAYAAFAGSVLIFVIEQLYVNSEVLKWFIIGFDVLSILGLYRVVNYVKQNYPKHIFMEYEEELAFGAGLIVLVDAIFQYAAAPWISLSLGCASVALILAGFVSGFKTERLGGMALLALTLGRVVLVDLSGLDIIFKIITLIVLGILFLGVSYVYNRFNIKKNE